MSTPARKPAGSAGSTGGQFAPTRSGEAAVDLPDALSAFDGAVAQLHAELGRPLYDDEKTVLRALLEGWDAEWAWGQMRYYRGDIEVLIDLCRHVRDDGDPQELDYEGSVYIEPAVDPESDWFGLYCMADIPGTNRSMTETVYTQDIGSDDLPPAAAALADVTAIHRRLKVLSADAARLGQPSLPAPV